MPKREEPQPHDAWASFRFAIVGPLLARPPSARGELLRALLQLAQTSWRHPITGEPVKFAVSTIERWYYQARSSPSDPVGALRNRIRQDAGTHTTLSPLLRQAVLSQYHQHASWSVQLHYDNLEQLGRDEPALGSVPSYATLRRYMKSQGLSRRKKLPQRPSAGQLRAVEHLEQREVRSYETEYVHELWHLDFHVASRKVLTRASVNTQKRPYVITQNAAIRRTGFEGKDTEIPLFNGRLLRRRCTRGLADASRIQNTEKAPKIRYLPVHDFHNDEAQGPSRWRLARRSASWPSPRFRHNPAWPHLR